MPGKARDWMSEVRRLRALIDKTSGGNDIPIGDPVGTNTSVAYTDPASGHPVTVLTFPADTTAFAFAIAGDTYPRVVFRSDGISARGVLSFGDGTYDPADSGSTGNGTQIWADGRELNLMANGGSTELTVYGDSVGAYYPSGMVRTNVPVEVMGGISILSGTPSALGGKVGDICFTGLNTAGQRMYICTVTGAAGSATWVGIL